MVPALSLETLVPPKRPAFYNPLAKLSRDISIGVYKSFTRGRRKLPSMADCLSGVGARGVRVAAEAPEIADVYMNDINPEAVKLAKTSAKMNKVLSRCRFTTYDTCRFLIEHSGPETRFDLVDLDPFGSPTIYIDCALRSVLSGGLLSVTATDTAVLCGVHPQVALRKYFGRSLKTEYCHETSARLLLGSIAFQAMRLGLGVYPIFAHTSRHYVRVYVSITAGVIRARDTQKKLGYINHCFGCGNRVACEEVKEVCGDCGNRTKYAGPLWTHEMHNPKVLTIMERVYDELGMSNCQHIAEIALKEYGLPPYYFASDRATHMMKIRSPPRDRIISALGNFGYQATRTIFDPKGIRTDAPIKDFNRALEIALES